MLLKKFYLCAKLVATLGAILHVLVYAMCRPMPCATVGTVFLHAVRFYQAAHMGLGMGSMGSLLSASDPHCGGGAMLCASRISHLAAWLAPPQVAAAVAHAAAWRKNAVWVHDGQARPWW